jgi:hypothetical protein
LANDFWFSYTKRVNALTNNVNCHGKSGGINFPNRSHGDGGAPLKVKPERRIVSSSKVRTKRSAGKQNYPHKRNN